MVEEHGGLQGGQRGGGHGLEGKEILAQRVAHATCSKDVLTRPRIHREGVEADGVFVKPPAAAWLQRHPAADGPQLHDERCVQDRFDGRYVRREEVRVTHGFAAKLRGKPKRVVVGGEEPGAPHRHEVAADGHGLGAAAHRVERLQHQHGCPGVVLLQAVCSRKAGHARSNDDNINTSHLSGCSRSHKQQGSEQEYPHYSVWGVCPITAWMYTSVRSL
mmetsp:Transcript_45681/g.114972  ORF Transcript_45681/g.114972 Transcript_45681/m.114972 type:complete len:218 (-) Transcript_45681:155-808(-)